jgi:phosphodiesterase/alkaline phosphatase D-like protein
MDRRKFLMGAGALSAATILPEPLYARERRPESGFSILQGLTTETTTQLSVDIERNLIVHYSLTDVETGKIFVPTVKAVRQSSSDMRVDKLKFTGLELNHKYKLLVQDKKKKVLDERFLKTVDLNKKNARIGFMSCMNDSFGDMRDAWQAAASVEVDYLFFIGDSVYGDMLWLHGPNYLWRRYVNTRAKLPFYHWKNLTPVIAIWDDHDFGKNDRGGDYEHKDVAYEYFQTFFAQEPLENDQVFLNGFGNSRYFQAFGQNFVFFDSRFYRGLTNSAGQKGFLGVEQIDWMSKVIYDRPKPTLAITGSPFYGRLQKTASYQVNAPEEFEYFKQKMRGWGVPAMFIAGDLHYSEVSSIAKSEVGYDTVEIVSSCMHSTKKTKYYDNPNPHISGYTNENFIVLEKSGLSFDPTWRMTCIAASGKIPFEGDIEIG